ncbi:MAG TPA: AAA family ATPase, partial [Opitutaceae bacterium]|nr:AAA family ATPase [Opitutaceae bacterium]
MAKFAPLHKGHEFLLRRALEECDELFAISYSKPELEGCPALKREGWMSGLFPTVHHLALTDARLRELAKPGEVPLELPHNDGEVTAHRRFCGLVCLRTFGVTVDAVFTSEDYGDGFAEELSRCFREHHASCPNVVHVCVDRERRSVPISASRIRQDVHAHRDWLSPEVYGSFVKRVCLLGGESTGKSTLAESLAKEFGTAHVAEYGREIWDAKAGTLAFEDMRHIAGEQIRREESALMQSNRWLFCDTSPLTTLFYSHHMFGKADPELGRLAERRYDLTILCMPDFPFVQDGTRQPEGFRDLQHQWYLG